MYYFDAGMRLPILKKKICFIAVVEPISLESCSYSAPNYQSTGEVEPFTNNL
jgi:hypothetical protein